MKVSQTWESKNKIIQGSFLLQAQLNSNFPKEKIGWEADTSLAPKRQVICVMWPDGIHSQRSVILANPHMLPQFSTWLLGSFKMQDSSDMLYKAGVVKAWSKIKCGPQFNEDDADIKMTRGHWFFRRPQLSLRDWSFNFAGLMEAYGSSKPEAWSQIGLNIGQDLNYSHIGSGVRVGRIQELLLWNKAIPYPRKENVIIYSYKKHQV